MRSAVMLSALLVSSSAAAQAASLPCALPLLGGPPPVDLPAYAPLPPDATLEARDAYGDFPNELVSEHFIVKWGTSGGVQEEDVAFLIAAFEDAWRIEIDEMGHPAPPGSDRYLFNVYIGDSGSGTPDGYGSAGYYYTDPDGYPMVVVAADTLSDAAYAEITAAHEFYHAIQGGLETYTYTGDAAWYWEATAEWAAGQVYPDNDYAAIFLMGLAYLPYLSVNFFDYPDRGTLQEYHQYGAFIFPTFLSEHVADWTLIRDSWVVGGSRDPLESLDQLLVEYDTSIQEVFPWFAAHNTTWDYANGDAYAYMLDYYEIWYGEDDHRVVAELPVEGTDGWVNGPADTLPQRYGYNVLRLEDPPAGELVLGFNGDEAGSKGSAARWGVIVVTEKTREVAYVEVSLTDNAGSSTLTLDGTEKFVHVAIAATPEETEEDETFGYSYELRWAEPDTGPGETGETGGDEGGGEGGGVLPDDKSGGCACASAGSPGGTALGLIVTLLGLLRGRYPARRVSSRI